MAPLPTIYSLQRLHSRTDHSGWYAYVSECVAVFLMLLDLCIGRLTAAAPVENCDLLL